MWWSNTFPVNSYCEGAVLFSQLNSFLESHCVNHRKWFGKLIFAWSVFVSSGFVHMIPRYGRKQVRAGWILRKWDSLIISSICGYEMLDSERTNMYRAMFTNESSKSNKRKMLSCAGWPRWGQYQYWRWHHQVPVLHDDNLIKMYWWQKAYQTQNVLVHRLVCLTKVTPIFSHKATAKFISGLAKFFADNKGYEVQIYWTSDMLIIHHEKCFFLMKHGCVILTPYK